MLRMLTVMELLMLAAALLLTAKDVCDKRLHNSALQFLRQLDSKAVDVSTYLILDGTKSGAANRTIGAAIDPAGNVV